MILTPKRSTEAVFYTFPWLKQLGDDVIASYTLAVTSGTVTLSEEVNDNRSVGALITGGANGETATLLLTITTAAGQVLKRDLTLLISDSATAIYPSTSTKRDVVEMAFEEMTLAGYEFDATPEEYRTALRRLDGLMAEWASGQSLDLGYLFPATFGTSDLDDASGIPDFSINTVAIYLAERMMPTLGKPMSAESRVAKAQAMTALRAALAVIPNRPIPLNTARGAGAKPSSTWNPFTGVDGAA